MGKRNTYNERDGYEVGGFPTCSSYGRKYFSTRNDDTEIRIEERVYRVGDPTALVERVNNFSDTHSEVKCRVETVYDPGRREPGFWLMGWRETTADERSRIEKMKERRKRKAERERAKKRELEKKRQEEITQQQAEKLAKRVGGEDQLIAEALKVLKKRGARVTIESGKS